MQDRQPLVDPFVGRAAELARIAEVITRVEAGQPWLVAIEGDSGMGKTALARRLLAEAPGLRVLQARADQAEADLDFGIVDQLLQSGRGSLSGGWAGQRDLIVRRGRAAAGGGGRAAGRGPVAIVVDDLQWADRRSVEALTFMLRRLSVDPVLAVLIYRGPGDRLGEAAQRMLLSVENRLFVPLGGLHLEEVASLAAALGTGLDEEAVQRLYQGTGGIRCTCARC